MSNSIISTKLYIPTARSKTVLRRRLIARLNNGLYRKLTLISAPAGYGKTTLASAWVADCGRPTAWLSLEQGDNELTRFLAYIISALQTVTENVGGNVLPILQSPQPVPTESILTALLNEITGISSSFILVLDDYHAASSSEIDAAVCFLIDHLPSQMHLVITTREAPTFSLARIRARDQLTELRAADMTFTMDEAEVFLNHVMELELSADHIAELQLRTEGWAAGLRLAAISIEEGDDADRLLQSYSGNHHFVLDYLAEEVLQQQPKDIQYFLLRTSILDRLCETLCDELLSHSEISSKALLSELERKNLFVIPLDKERRWYRYHHLFADILRQRLQDTLDEQEVLDLHKRASIWYEDNGFEIEAFHHAVCAQDIARSARLLRGGGLPLHLRGAARIVLNWLESLPSKDLDERPELWVYYGSVLLIVGKPTEVEHKLNAAELALGRIEQAEHMADLKELHGWMAATRATLASLSLAEHDEGAHLQTAEETMQASDQVDKTEDLVGLIAPVRHRTASSGAEEINTIEGIDRVIDQSRRALMYLHPDNLPARTASAWMLGVACQRKGDYAAALAAYEEVISNCRRLDHQVIGIMAMIGIAQIKEAEGQYEQAAERYESALKLAGNLSHPAIQEAHMNLERIHRFIEAGIKSNGIEPLSQRELEVLQLIAEGLSNREIADRLFLALDTVKGHNRRIFEKLHVQRRTEAIARAIELNLLSNTPKQH